MDGSDEFIAGKLFKSTCISVSVIDLDSYETEITPVSVFNFPYILKLGKLSEDHPVTDNRMTTSNMQQIIPKRPFATEDTLTDKIFLVSGFPIILSHEKWHQVLPV